MKKAFTMIEIIFVIVIIGILSGIAIPKMLSLRTDAKITSLKDQVSNIRADIENISRNLTLSSLDSSGHDVYPDVDMMKEQIKNRKYVDIKKSNANDYTYQASIKGFGDFVFVYVDGKVSKPGNGIIPSDAKVGDFICVKPDVEKCKLFNQ